MNGTRCTTERSGTGETRGPLHRQVPATVENASLLRRDLRDWLDVDVAPDLAEDLVLAVYEALANAVEHAYRHEIGPLLLVARRERGGISVEVSDEGAWKDGPSGAFRGRGIPLMHQLSDEACLLHSAHGTTVVLWVDTASKPAQHRKGVSSLTG